MNSIDLFILVPIVWGAFKGYRRGFLLTFISLISFFLALVLGLKFYQVIMEAIAPSINVSESFLPYLAFFITFGLIWFGINKLGDYLKRVLDTTLLGGVDNLAGAVIGGLKFAFFISLFLWLFNKLGAFEQKTFEESAFYEWVQPIGPYVIANSSKILLAGQDVMEEIEKVIQDDQNNSEGLAPEEEN